MQSFFRASSSFKEGAAVVGSGSSACPLEEGSLLEPQTVVTAGPATERGDQPNAKLAGLSVEEASPHGAGIEGQAPRRRGPSPRTSRTRLGPGEGFKALLEGAALRLGAGVHGYTGLRTRSPAA